MTQPESDAPPLPGEDHPEARERTVDNLKTLGLAMGWYVHVHDGRFPPAAIYKEGEPLLSWRVVLLPFLGQKVLYERFRLDEPWDSPSNRALLEEMPAIYAPVVPKRQEQYMTYYQGFVGHGTLFDGSRGRGPRTSPMG
jgi:hypothetical protein